MLFGTASLAVQFWDLYCICNEKTKTRAEVWFNRELRLIFRRTFSSSIMQNWNELREVVEQVNLNEDSDLWCSVMRNLEFTHNLYML
jgi:hypothetical protein